MKTMKGQSTIVGIFMSFISFFLVSMLLPVIYPVVDTVKTSALSYNDTTTAFLAGLFPPFLQLGALVGPIAWTWFSQNQRRQMEGG